jgi:soluble lytic murein transglycosylase-like protein
LALPFLIGADIVVKQDENGKIVITNTGSSSPANKIRKARSSKSRSNRKKTFQVPDRYLGKIRRLASMHEVREDLVVAVIRAESSFNPNALSHKGAAGLMQLMPDTARQYGVTNRFDPDQNLKAGVQHLSYLYSKYKKNIPLTLAAYNAGEEAVKKYKGIPPYKETKGYIKRAMKFMGMRYSPFFSSGANTTIYKYKTADGRTVISDTPPAQPHGKVEIFK